MDAFTETGALALPAARLALKLKGFVSV